MNMAVRWIHRPENSYRRKLVTLLPVARSTKPWQRRIFFGLLVAVILAIVCGSALAQPTPSSSGGAGHFNQGIPVYWPDHAILMSAGFILLGSGFVIARFHKTKNWYKTHMILETIGGACVIIGLFIGIYMVTLSGLPHLRNIHEMLGAIVVIILIITMTLGYFIKRASKSKNVVRISHRWLGRISLILIAINIALGFLFLSMILRR